MKLLEEKERRKQEEKLKKKWVSDSSCNLDPILEQDTFFLSLQLLWTSPCIPIICIMHVGKITGIVMGTRPSTWPWRAQVKVKRRKKKKRKGRSLTNQTGRSAMWWVMWLNHRTLAPGTPLWCTVLVCDVVLVSRSVTWPGRWMEYCVAYIHNIHIVVMFTRSVTWPVIDEVHASVLWLCVYFC